jgi:deazaflavin-dependent oxidoreductase (nitroreductase family)
MVRMAATRPMSWFYARTIHHVDRIVFRLTGGRHTFVALASGLPVVMLTTTGARSGAPRSVPVLGIPVGERVAVIGSNYGQRHHPAWYHNLRANPRASITMNGVTRAMEGREASDEERERLWRRGLEIYPGWSIYEQRASTRQIPIVVLSPVADTS